MYSILIVDDERPALEILSYYIDTFANEYKIIGKATNGKDAYDAYKKLHPDIIITDIQMPVMDGISLIEKIRVHDPKQKFVILTCHENFYYAQKSIKMDVSDYLIKDLLTEESILKTLEKVKKDILSTQVSHSENTNTSRTPLETLKSIIFAEDDSENIEDQHISFHFSTNYFILLCLHIDDYENIKAALGYNHTKENIQKITKCIHHTLASHLGGEVLYNEKGEFIIIACIHHKKSQLENMTESQKIVNMIRSKCLAFYDFSTTIYVSRPFDHIHMANKVYKETYDMVSYKIFFDDNKNIYYHSLPIHTVSSKPDIFRKKIDLIKTAVSAKDILSLTKVIHELYYDDLTKFMQYGFLQYVNSTLLDIIHETARSNNISYKDLFGYDYIPYPVLRELKTVHSMANWFIIIFEKLIHLLKEKEDFKYNTLIQQAIEIIHTEFSSKDLGLSEIANRIGVHKVYLSRLFKEETGFNLSSYILNIRVEHAKKLLLLTDMKIYEICDSCGFSSPSKLNVAFKKNAGITPKQYKKKARG
ncbi:MAG: response regulator [Marinisporobacter sp.]|jgi:two-component system response regulator YesN|nr:response regulator [Marinisporobacter sp.]